MQALGSFACRDAHHHCSATTARVDSLAALKSSHVRLRLPAQKMQSNIGAKNRKSWRHISSKGIVYLHLPPLAFPMQEFEEAEQMIRHSNRTL